MNIFRLVADILHLVSFGALIHKIKTSKNCLGISYKTQEIYMVVFLTRYWDLLLYYVSMYNTLMKIFYIGCTAYIIYLIRIKKPYCLSYDPVSDGFPHAKFLYPAAAILALIIHPEFSAFEISWSFSIWLEALAILPQIDMVRRHKEVENITGHYMACLGVYRGFYILNWIYRYFSEGLVTWTSVLGGIVQTIIYADFLLVYFKAKQQSLKGSGSIKLPV
ncbi:hypothetical protein PPERSA_01942 [Pseudocohnilembus persalinus]|uniref:ER lumen protein-retaining receptor n=1 Tax=Pseudocohnilembus persalinus TaxID=266149 RepID=A0A0V0R3I3_PSEPJ|nr:hypothetical protein PPERSA_01942 [Pseudocohnilembus persalinus]|eukprot:KRX09055.1 hypothetical protein PPERSA_01942 [Pseudocohnilembus persalinus]